MKNRILSLLMAFCLMLTLAPAALAADVEDDLVNDQITADVSEEEAPVAEEPVEMDETVADPDPDAAAPTVESLTITVGSTVYAATVNADGSMYLPVLKDVSILDCVVSMTTSEPVKFIPTTNPPAGALYVSASDSNRATLHFNATVGSVNLNDSEYGMAMSSEDGIVWTGQKNVLGSFVEIPFSSFATAMAGYENLGLAAGSMKSVANDVPNEFQRVICNQDNRDVVLVFCDGDSTIYTVNYVCSGSTYTWQLPAGAPLIMPEPALQTGQTLEGWYSDADYTNGVSESTAVTGNMTLYAKVTGSDTSSSFSTQLDNNASVLSINNMDDWNAFIQRASEVTSSQRVELTTDIDCTGQSAYTALTFAGDFDGKGHTISNATFNANGSNSGMFATIGAGQKIVNLTLSYITVGYAENAGILAGSISASGSARALIQNVQIRNGEVEGRNTGALVGYTFLSDIKYCSSRDVALSGLINVGGIAGISYSQITYCYSTCSVPTSNIFRKTGGIVAKNLEASNVQWCWCTASAAIGQSGTDSAASNNYVSVNQWTSSESFEDKDFTQNCWALDDGTDTDFNYDVVTYSFSN